MMLNAMATGEGKTDYVTALDANALKGTRVGVARFSEGTNGDIIEHFNAALQVLENAGATLVEIEEFEQDREQFGEYSFAVLQYEFKATLNEYLADAAPAVPARSLADVIAFNERNSGRELALFDQSIMDLSEQRPGLNDPEYLAARDFVQSGTRENGIDALMAQYEVNVLVSPSGPVSPRVDPINGDVWPNWAGAGGMAAIAGYPHVTVPMGTVHGVPVGFSFIGAKNQDAEVLSFGYAYEQQTHLRAAPQYLKDAEARPEIAAAMKRPAN